MIFWDSQFRCSDALSDVFMRVKHSVVSRYCTTQEKPHLYSENKRKFWYTIYKYLSFKLTYSNYNVITKSETEL
jgi:phage FluMu gp28-like protein